MDIKKSLIQKLVTEENMSFLLDVNELMPDILIEIRAKIFENGFRIPESWNGYKLIRDGDIFYLTDIRFSSERFFRFSIYIGNQDGNLFFGITGPWDAFNADIIGNLQMKSESLGLTRWSKWWYKYFNTSRDSFYSSIRNNQNPETVMVPFSEEFFEKCSGLKELLEAVNEKLIIN